MDKIFFIHLLSHLSFQVQVKLLVLLRNSFIFVAYCDKKCEERQLIVLFTKRQRVVTKNTSQPFFQNKRYLVKTKQLFPNRSRLSFFIVLFRFRLALLVQVGSSNSKDGQNVVGRRSLKEQDLLQSFYFEQLKT